MSDPPPSQPGDPPAPATHPQLGYPPPAGQYQPPQVGYPPPPAEAYHGPAPGTVQPGFPPPPSGMQQPQAGPPQPAGPYQGVPVQGQYQQMPQTTGYQQMPSSGYPPPPQGPGYQPVPQQGHIVVQPQRWMRVPQVVECSHCRSTVTTTIRYESGLLTWLSCGGLCIIGCWLGCCFIPFCIDPLKDVQHVCPNCNWVLGEAKAMS